MKKYEKEKVRENEFLPYMTIFPLLVVSLQKSISEYFSRLFLCADSKSGFECFDHKVEKARIVQRSLAHGEYHDDVKVYKLGMVNVMMMLRFTCSA